MNKYEVAQYLVNLLTLMTSKEEAGRARGRTLAAEYDKTYAGFIAALREEQEKPETQEPKNG